MSPPFLFLLSKMAPFFPGGLSGQGFKSLKSLGLPLAFAGGGSLDFLFFFPSYQGGEFFSSSVEGGESFSFESLLEGDWALAVAGLSRCRPSGRTESFFCADGCRCFFPEESCSSFHPPGFGWDDGPTLVFLPLLHDFLFRCGRD